ncbi:N-acetylmuramoyl-L-alanine amidase [Pusillimonas noertemannii]|uniref:N-acetylmuramoyl-L-alanine amidase n=1 Tax=Pusillimonas noertemannii TaxID=305977 RepID=A0A2U1CMD7_9BURK|nr:N-acetylmuramoyl-L-alanine amidase [Pusillimonas noertemannii]NYT68825.1 N-acetylmuramoyl-L-alanine amidase [Pusillimonas noertemannii]PVY62151.1 N-acetylmuramoyl-L-alanine amidase [Pusillimonas noertemannii]TFL10860.1 N-acetylmuramoyl-L-alanine amidase [Pusillimonas noertemannii]
MSTIVITAGHSNVDPGATNGVVTEAHIVTDFRNMVAHYLRQAAADIRTDGEGNENLSLNAAIKLIKPRHIAVEFHCNAFTNPSATGVETLSQDKDKALGAKLCEAVANVLGIVNRGAKGEGSGQHSRLGYVRAGGIILELFFISNPDDLRRYLDKKWLVAREVANVLMVAADA